MVIFNSYVSLPEGKPLAMVFTEVFAQLRKTKNEMKGHPAIGHGTPDVLPHKGRIKMVKTHTHTLKKLEVHCTVWKWVWRTWEDHFTVEVLKHVYTCGI